MLSTTGDLYLIILNIFRDFFDIWLDRNKHDFMTRVKEGQNLVFAFFFILFALD